MIDNPTTTTIDPGYAECVLHLEDTVTTTPAQFALTLPPINLRCAEDRRQSRSVASMLHRYSPPTRTQFSRAVVAGAIFYSPALGERAGPVRAGLKAPAEWRLPDSRREKYAEAIALLDTWLADESGYDEDTWPTLRQGIDRSRTSTRKRFGD